MSGTDKMAQIAGTFNTMLEKAQSSIEAYNAMRQKRVEFADVVSKIADGDLTSQIHVASDKDQIGQAFSEMLDSLRDIASSAQIIGHGNVYVAGHAEVRERRARHGLRRDAELPAGDGRRHRADRDSNLGFSVELRSERDALGIAFDRMTENVSPSSQRSGPRRNRLTTASGRMGDLVERAYGGAVEEIANAVATSPPGPSARHA